MTIRFAWVILIVLLAALLTGCFGESTDPGESTDIEVSAKYDEVLGKSNRLQAESCPAAESDWDRLAPRYDEAERDYFNASTNSGKLDALERIDDLLDDIKDAIDNKC